MEKKIGYIIVGIIIVYALYHLVRNFQESIFRGISQIVFTLIIFMIYYFAKLRKR